MAKASRAYDRVLSHLREGVRLGGFQAGTQFNIKDVADQLRVSATPVREALAYLAGEGLIGGDRGRGWIVPDFDARGLTQAYRLSATLVIEALGRPHRAAPLARARLIDLWRSGAATWDADPESAWIDATSRFFRLLAREAADETLDAALARIDARLGLPRRAEVRALSDVTEELDRLARAFVDEPGTFNVLCLGYFERRTQAAEWLAALVPRRS